MTIIDQVTSISEKKGNNYVVAELCARDPEKIQEVVDGLVYRDGKVVADCAEVLTEIALTKPELVAPFGGQILPILYQKNNRARWETMHCLSLIASLRPEIIEQNLEQFSSFIETHDSVIVRDYAIDAIGNFAGTSLEAARKAMPILEKSLYVWEGRHAGHALEGLIRIVPYLPSSRAHLQEIASAYLTAKNGAVRKSASRLARILK